MATRARLLLALCSPLATASSFCVPKISQRGIAISKQGRTWRTVSRAVVNSDADAAMSTHSKQSGPYGGDFAGMYATFSPLTGELVRVPENLVPESMIEWGQVPASLEVLLSEDFVGDDEQLERKTDQVLPAVGCGVDNLDMMRVTEMIQTSSMNVFEDQTAALEHNLSPLTNAPRIHTETTFSLPLALVPEEDDKKYAQRVRVTFDIQPTLKKLSSPVGVTVERQTSSTSSKGSIGVGGGLHGSTVMSLVGSDAINKPFAEGESVDIKDVFDDGEGTFTTLSLPGNIIVRYGADLGLEEILWQVEVSHISENAGTWTLVKRVYDAQNGERMDLEHMIE
uniref:Uncharacterized protein n=1 Tax=Attheya septentrionalis TaxID=420275 RepID=A0A7S2XMT8_9STRA|mmetsp:Transcript_21805/g.39396  ORF Transcript_21805/g.39396 Transcript_21805/m.39396 type:complete len:339 (+) Transcript_21805:25-1041(+)